MARPLEDGARRPATARIDADAPSFIETQFPVSKLSKESYKERQAKNSQTLTGLGKWWGRKPLVMVRAVILGLLMPASDDPKRDLAVFLALLTMDEKGLWRRKTRNVPLKEVFSRLPPEARRHWFEPDCDPTRPKLKRGTKATARQLLQRLVFDGMSYDDKLKWCNRPEQIDGPPPEAWQSINEHLGVTASSLPELVRELGMRRFGRAPRVGDAFCGGGSIPFEAARLGCDAYGSDLNPVAALLTWGALNIVGGGEVATRRLRRAQEATFAALDRQVTEWRIEHNEFGWRADAFLYCTETRCPECRWRVPLAPSWVVGEKDGTLARLVPVPDEKAFTIAIRSGVDRKALAAARSTGTVKASRLECPNCGASTAMATIRGDRKGKGGKGHGLRLWKNADLVPGPNDVFQERLYCVRWRLPSLEALFRAEHHRRAGSEPCSEAENKDAPPVPCWVRLDAAIEALAALLDGDARRRLAKLREHYRPGADRASVAWAHSEIAALDKALPKSVYRAVEEADLAREARTLALLEDRFSEWQRLGYLPSRKIAPGAKTDEPIRTRGWTHWHHLFTPRQLLTLGTLSQVARDATAKEVIAAATLGLYRCADRNSRLCHWHPRTVGDKSERTFTNQAFNTFWNYPARGLLGLASPYQLDLATADLPGHKRVAVEDARAVAAHQDVWLTDPPYADAINYHELSEYFLAWEGERLTGLLPGLYTDSKRALAVRGNGAGFRQSMVDCYRNLATRMPDNGLQVVMFTHQDAAVWADLTLILWAAGLRVTAAWTIATETESALKEGNYVQGTVLMVLRKQSSNATAFLDELVPEVEAEVERQLETMLALDDHEEPNFTDADYQLAAYAAAMRVLTQYGAIEDIDIAGELVREAETGTTNPIEKIIENAVRTASNVLIPARMRNSPSLWLRLGAEERLYLKGLEVESHGDYRAGVYQEFARGFGVRDYRALLRTGKANETRLKTASELRRSGLGNSTFGESLVRHALYATWRAAETEEVAESLTWLRTELPDYWNRRDALATVLRYFSCMESEHWRHDADAARLVAGAVENDHV